MSKINVPQRRMIRSTTVMRVNLSKRNKEKLKEVHDLADLLKVGPEMRKLYSEKLVKEYIPLTNEQKENELKDLNLQSQKRFTEYSNIFDQIKDHITDINNSLTNKRSSIIAFTPNMRKRHSMANFSHFAREAQKDNIHHSHHHSQHKRSDRRSSKTVKFNPFDNEKKMSLFSTTSNLLIPANIKKEKNYSLFQQKTKTYKPKKLHHRIKLIENEGDDNNNGLKLSYDSDLDITLLEEKKDLINLKEFKPILTMGNTRSKNRNKHLKNSSSPFDNSFNAPIKKFNSSLNSPKHSNELSNEYDFYYEPNITNNNKKTNEIPQIKYCGCNLFI
jgi:hypothetical protein